jgi:ribosomal-protein-alanine N-acetyltransferase
MAGSGLNIELRPGGRDDLESIAHIQAASPEASQWDVPEYLKYDLTVAACDGRIAGFAVARRVAEGESELLNLAVDPAFRRRGIGRRLIAVITSGHPGDLWLEVRESNVAARNFYKSLGFLDAGRRAGYYPDSYESAIVMNVHS